MNSLLKQYELKLFSFILLLILIIPAVYIVEANEYSYSKGSLFQDIELIEVQGGLNLKITLKNKGDQEYRNVKITTKITGGIIFNQRVKNYTIPLLTSVASSDTYTIQSQIIGFGLGFLKEKPQISIFLNDDEETVVIGQIEARIIGLNIKVTDTLLNEENVYDGYTLYTPEYSKNTYLVDNNGEVFHQWSSSYIQGMKTCLLENGIMVRADSPYPPHPNLLAGGFTGHIGFYNAKSECIWEYTYSNRSHCLHHGFEVLPNGNILLIAVEYKNYVEAVHAGRNYNKLKYEKLCPDYLIEVKPNGSRGGEIVWEWHVWDHLIQDFDESKNNYGVVEDHPELIDINYGADKADFTHINSIDYNEEFDQILLSVREFNEIWVIDHSTSTEEAASHSGGDYGMGGDLLYRWGNPITYHMGTEQDQQLFSQHDAEWIPMGYPGEGNILIFNNQIPLQDSNNPNLRAYSSVMEIDPPVTQNGEYKKFGFTYGPHNPVWEYTDDNEYNFYSSFLSSSQRLPNGNTLICEGNKGKLFEVNKEHNIVWQYTNTIGFPNHVFSAQKYSMEYQGIKNLIQMKTS